MADNQLTVEVRDAIAKMTTHSPATRATSMRRHLRPSVALAVAALAATPLLWADPVAADVSSTSNIVVTQSSGIVIGRGGASGAVHATLTNVGGKSANAVVARYVLPSDIDFVATAGCAESSRIVKCSLGSMGPGENRSVDISVAERNPDAAFGTRAGYFLAPLTDGFDPGAGEIRVTEWNHEAGAEGTDLRGCWPVGNPTPNMDVGGGVCNGSNDAGPLAPSAQYVTDRFPDAYSQAVVRSWQFETQFTAPSSGTFRSCGTSIDDGGYVAVAPAGSGFSNSSVVLSTSSFGTATGPPFSLVGGRRYDVLIRVSNRGLQGTDNGNSGYGGWISFGFADASTTCNAADSIAMGTGDAAWIDRHAADVVVKGASDLSIVGAVESAPTGTKRQASARIINLGSDPSAATATVLLPAGSSLVDGADGCIIAAGKKSATCAIGTLGAGRSGVAAIRFAGTRPGAMWVAGSSSSIDPNTSNNTAPR